MLKYIIRNSGKAIRLQFSIACSEISQVKPFLKKASVLTGLMLFSVFTVRAQKSDIYFEHLTVEKGLSQSTVFSIAQDKLGFMWFGTKDGLNRYDSRHIEIYKHNPNDTTTLSSSININTLLVDSKGNLWVGTQNGLNKYLPETNSFQRFLHHPQKENTISNNTIRYLYEDRQGNIWIGTDNGLNRLLDNGTFERYNVSDNGNGGLAHRIVKAIYQDKNNTLWVGTLSGLTSMVHKNGSYSYTSYFNDPKNPNSISGNDISSITEDNNGNLWIGTRLKGLNLYDRTAKTFTRFTAGGAESLSSNDIRKITIDLDGNLWIATLNGINIYNPVLHKFKVYVNEPENPLSLSQNSIYDIFQDVSGSVWIGTYYGGVNVCHNTVMPFKTYMHYSYKNSLSSNIVSAIAEDKAQNLWIGTEAEGLNYYNRKTGLFTKYKHQPNASNSLSSNLIKSIALDDEGKLWIAAYEGGVDVYNPATGIFKNYKKSNNRFSFLLKDSQQRMWVASRGKGLFLYNKPADDLLPVKLPAQFIYYLFEDKGKTIWIATSKGLFYLKTGSAAFTGITLKNNPSIFQAINCIQQDNKGIIWLGSLNEGLIAYDPHNRTAKIYTVSNGLPSNNITAVVEDNEKTLWISTTRGLAKLESGTFRVYTKEDGLPGNVFNHNSFLKDSKGELFFGGYNGMVSFCPEEIQNNKKVPEIVFTRLKLFNKEVTVNDDTGILKQSVTTTGKIELSYNQNVFSIDFSALNYVKPEKNRYAYKLEGADKQWTYTSIPSISFSNLSDGEYTLLVKGANNDGLWNNEAVALKIKVNPPFWKSWWAYLFYLSVIAGVFLAIARYLFLQALLKKEHEINQQKLDFFTHVSHEIRTPLTLIAGPVETLIQDTSENKFLNQQLLGVNKNVKRLLRLINELMDFRKIESGKMLLKVEKSDLRGFVKDIYMNFATLAEQRKIDYIFSCKEENTEAFFDRNQLEKVIFNLLSNAFKFVPDGGKITVQITEDKQKINIKIVDNGPGIPLESRDKLFTEFYQAVNNRYRNAGTGIGLALARHIALLHKGNLILDDTEAETCFLLTLKKGFSHFSAEELSQSDSPETVQEHAHIVLSEEEPVISEEEATEQENKLQILVVDDNPEILQLITSALSKKYAIVTAKNGAEALSVAQNNIPDLIISDVMMPEMDGYEFCDKIKTDERTNHIPVILLTARYGDNYELEGLKTGADLYITKPFGVEKLQYHVDNLLELKENIRRKFSQYLELEPTSVSIESPDKVFIAKVMALLEENIDNPEFNVNQFAAEIGMSTPVFYKKIKAITGLTVNNFVKSIRLKRAAQLLSQNVATVYEVAYMTGFNDPKYFSKEFRKQYGKSPSEYMSS